MRTKLFAIQRTNNNIIKFCRDATVTTGEREVKSSIFNIYFCAALLLLLRLLAHSLFFSVNTRQNLILFNISHLY